MNRNFLIDRVLTVLHWAFIRQNAFLFCDLDFLIKLIADLVHVFLRCVKHVTDRKSGVLPLKFHCGLVGVLINFVRVKADYF